MTQQSNFTIRWGVGMNIQEGFMILAARHAIVPWKTDPRVLLFNYPELVTEENGLTILHPVQIGKIVIKENIIYKKQGWNLPLFINEKGIRSYRLIKNALEVTMRVKGVQGNEFIDQNTAKFYISLGKVAFRLEYPLPATESRPTGQIKPIDGCLLQIEFNSMVEHTPKKEIRRQQEHTHNYRREHGY